MDRITSTPDALTRRKKPVSASKKQLNFRVLSGITSGNLGLSWMRRIGNFKVAIVGPDQTAFALCFCVPSKALADARNPKRVSTRDPLASNAPRLPGNATYSAKNVTCDNYLVR